MVVRCWQKRHLQREESRLRVQVAILETQFLTGEGRFDLHRGEPARAPRCCRTAVDLIDGRLNLNIQLRGCPLDRLALPTAEFPEYGELREGCHLAQSALLGDHRVLHHGDLGVGGALGDAAVDVHQASLQLTTREVLVVRQTSWAERG